jgi:hypothetical protein
MYYFSKQIQYFHSVFFNVAFIYIGYVFFRQNITYNFRKGIFMKEISSQHLMLVSGGAMTAEHGIAGALTGGLSGAGIGFISGLTIYAFTLD